MWRTAVRFVYWYASSTRKQKRVLSGLPQLKDASHREVHKCMVVHALDGGEDWPPKVATPPFEVLAIAIPC